LIFENGEGLPRFLPDVLKGRRPIIWEKRGGAMAVSTRGRKVFPFFVRGMRHQLELWIDYDTKNLTRLTRRGKKGNGLNRRGGESFQHW